MGYKSTKKVKSDEDYTFLIFKYPSNLPLSNIPDEFKEYFYCIMGKGSHVAKEIKEMIENE